MIDKILSIMILLPTTMSSFDSPFFLARTASVMCDGSVLKESLINDLELNEYVDTHHYIQSSIADRKLSEILSKDLGDNDIDMIVILGHYLVHNRNIDEMFENCFSNELSFLTYQEKLKTFSFIDQWRTINW